MLFNVAIAAVLLSIVFMLFYAGYIIGQSQRSSRAPAPVRYRELGDDYEHQMRILQEDNLEISKRWEFMSKLISSLANVGTKGRLCTLGARLIRESVRADYSAVIIREGKVFKAVATDGLHVESEENMVFDHRDPLLYYLKEQPKTITLTPSDRQFRSFRNLQEKFDEILMMPMVMGNDLEGVLWAGRREGSLRFSQGDKLVMEYLGNAMGYLVKNINLVDDLEKKALKIITGLSNALEQRDDFNKGHSSRVSAYSTMFCRYIGFPREQIEVIRRSALLHDIGNIGIPERLLGKPERFTPEEHQVIQAHPIYGVEVLKTLDFLKDELIIILHHHEKFDGTGYPYRLSGDQIPIGAQIIALADVFDALTTDRPYRQGFSIEKSIEVMQKMANEYFNADLLAQFLDFLEAQTTAGNAQQG